MSIEPFIKCRDIDRSIQFYTEILDFKVVQHPDTDPNSFLAKYAFLEREGNFIHLSMHAGDGMFGNSIYIRVKNVEPIAKKILGSKIGSIESKKDPRIRINLVDQSWGMREFGISDPDGNKITYGHKL